MAQATATKILPYRNFKFKVFFDKPDAVALVSKMSALKRTTEVVEWRCGGDSNTPRKRAGKTKFEPITMEQGISLDTDFEDWADRVNKFGEGGQAQQDNDFRKDIRVEVLDLDGQTVLKYKIRSCWVSEYTAVPDLDANANAVAIKTIKIENEGWERDK
jgi:phage tail-like protein